MNLNLTMPVKASLGASAAAGTSLAAAGAGGAFSSGAQLEKVEANKEDLVEESTTSEDEDDNAKQPQAVIENNPQEHHASTEIVPDLDQKTVNGDLVDVASKQTLEDNFSGLETEDSKSVKLVSQDQTQSYAQGTIGYRYSRFLVSVNGSEENGNRDWWNEKYKEQYKNSDNEEPETDYYNPFKTSKEITKAYDENLSEDSLNGLCHSFYKLQKKTEEIKEIPEHSENSKSYSIWEGIWMFCSPEKLDPYYIGDNSSGHDKPSANLISHSLQNKLLSTAENENEFIWEKLNYHFFETEEVEDLYFKPFKDSKISLKSSKTLLRNKCGEAYKIQTTVEVGKNRPSEEALLKYCSLND